MKVAYFVHDLADAAVRRRVRMLREGGAEVALTGFRRAPEPVADVEGIAPVDLGRTEDARLIRRVGSVLAATAGARWREVVSGADVVMARQLEMLVIAARARRQVAPAAPLVYECLDIHRLMASGGPAGAALRSLERRLIAHCALLVVSSGAFVREYFARVHPALPRVLLLENKILGCELGNAQPGRHETATRPPGPPWRIGWFGVIRCARSLDLLAGLVRLLPGQIEVLIRGRIAPTAVPDFGRVLARTPGIQFGGTYDRRTELEQIYGQVHFTWAVDFYEAGANSNWLLPNRLYEGGLYGAVPIALASVETGRWLAARHAGLLLEEPPEPSLERSFACMTPERYAAAQRGMAQIPSADFIHGSADFAAFVAALAALAGNVGAGRSAA